VRPDSPTVRLLIAGFLATTGDGERFVRREVGPVDVRRCSAVKVKRSGKRLPPAGLFVEIREEVTAEVSTPIGGNNMVESLS
jgi:hypothetical protein